MWLRLTRVFENGKDSWDIPTDTEELPSGTGCLWQCLEKVSFFQGPNKASKGDIYLRDSPVECSLNCHLSNVSLGRCDPLLAHSRNWCRAMLGSFLWFWLFVGTWDRHLLFLPGSIFPSLKIRLPFFWGDRVPAHSQNTSFEEGWPCSQFQDWESSQAPSRKHTLSLEGQKILKRGAIEPQSFAYIKSETRNAEGSLAVPRERVTKKGVMADRPQGCSAYILWVMWWLTSMDNLMDWGELGNS